jgi:hypothetical protein
LLLIGVPGFFVQYRPGAEGRPVRQAVEAPHHQAADEALGLWVTGVCERAE